jgi:hypothetical protein
MARQEFCWERQEKKLEAIYLDALQLAPQPVGARAR